MSPHQFIPTQPVPRTRPEPDADPEPTLLDRAVLRAGSDFPSAGTFVWARLVSA